VAGFASGAAAPTWTRRIPGPIVQIVDFEVAGDVLVVLLECSGCDQIHGLDTRTGEILWSLPRRGSHVYGWHAETVVVSLGNAGGFINGVAGIDRRSGRIAWQFGIASVETAQLSADESKLVRFETAGRLTLLDVATGAVLATADVSDRVQGITRAELSVMEGAVALTTSGAAGRTGSAHSATDLAALWRRDQHVLAVPGGRFEISEIGDRGPRQIVDAAGKTLWEARDRVFYMHPRASWGVLEPYGDGEQEFLRLTDGKRVGTADGRAPVFSEAGGALLRKSPGGRGAVPAEFFYLHMPSGDVSELGRLEESGLCAFSHTYVACADGDRNPGLWRYRDE
jgi:hypothetical protein